MNKKLLIAVLTVVMCLSLVIAACNAVFTVTFETNGGTAVETQKTGLISITPETEREGYIFEGWFDNKALAGSPVTFPYVVTADITLYAKWSPVGTSPNPAEKYIVEFETNGGSRVPAQNTAEIIAEPKTEREGYTFEGWFENEDLSGWWNRKNLPLRLTPTAVRR